MIQDMLRCGILIYLIYKVLNILSEKIMIQDMLRCGILI